MFDTKTKLTLPLRLNSSKYHITNTHTHYQTHLQFHHSIASLATEIQSEH
uniref:Uncharacterized protein n=1 Tax=Rhizophora mucronata TaxID=61149 RepID=A0A2P2IYN8_RHIMU